ncbi:hypothetical protein LCGC14_3001660 [marine sediment metagenome]|uniref:Uncharacterized protein n=1 Tax=marine sediment metagenome TaxID=412755 RepID=A0A0F8XNF7_9ZZZZ
MSNNVKNNVKRANVLDLITNGSKPGGIAQHTHTSETSIYRLLKRMRKDGLLTSNNELTEHGTEHVKKFMAVSSDVKFNIKDNDIRLHNVQVTIKILHKPRGYDYRKNNMIAMKVRDYDLTNLNNNYKEQFKVNDVTVKTNIDSIELFPKDIYAETEQQASKRLMDIVFEVIKRIENLYHVTLIKDNYCNIRISRQHYALVRNQLAKLYRNEHKGSVFRVFDEGDGKVRLVVDISQGPEFEAEHPSKSPSDINKCQTFFKDIIDKEHDLPSDTKGMIHELALVSKNTIQRQENSLLIEQEYARNMKTHVKVMKGIEKSFNKFNTLLTQKKLKEWL